MKQRWFDGHPILKLYESAKPISLWALTSRLVVTSGLILMGGWLIAYPLSKIGQPPKQEEGKVLGSQGVPTPTVTLPTPTKVPTPALTPAANRERNVYLVRFSQSIPAIKWKEPLSRLVANAIDPTGEKKITFNGLFYDTMTANPELKDFYLIKQKGELGATAYQLPEMAMEIQISDEALKPFLLNKRFCNTAADCVIRESYCTVGAFNRYEIWAGEWTCPQGKKTDFGTIIDVYDESNACVTKAEFEAVDCQANTCKALDEIISCK